MAHLVNSWPTSTSRRVFRYALNLTDYQPCESDLPNEFSLAQFSQGNDEKILLELNNEIFADHPDQGGWTLGQLYQRLCSADRSAHEVTFVRRHSIPVGFIWLKWHHLPECNPCEIYVLGLIESARRFGLARHLINQKAIQLHKSGCQLLWVYTDETNWIALKLYEERGFAVDFIEAL